MAIITLVRKPVPLKGFELSSPTHMLEALDGLASDGWRGQLNRTDNNGYQLELHCGGDVGSENPVGKIEASLGDVLVNDQGWRKLSAGEVAASYDILPEPDPALSPDSADPTQQTGTDPSTTEGA